MSEPYDCSKCGKSPDGMPWYHMNRNNYNHQFCSRRCLVEFIAPELSEAVVVPQWIDLPSPIGHTTVEIKRFIPTPEESERMSQ